jgi:hypothetical protein
VDAFFQDLVPGTVRLTISNIGLVGLENTDKFYFNLNPALSPAALVFSNPGGSGGFDLPDISTGVNAYKADGDGYYDVLFAFSTDGQTHRFRGGQYLVYDISGIATLAAADFAFLSYDGVGSGPYYAAASVQQIGGSGGVSGWIKPAGITYVPEPSSSVLLVLAVGGWLGARFSKRR